ncbi:MAG: sensor histidine kinase [Rubrimonas sp.]
MKRGFGLSNLMMIVALLATIAVVLVELRTRDLDDESVHAFRQENVKWHGVQANFELMRFIDSALMYERAPSAANAAKALERFDLLWSRAAIFRHGPMGERLRAVRDYGAVERLFDLLEFHASTAENLAAADPDARLAMIEDFRSMAGPMQRYFSFVADDEEQRMSAIQNDMIAANRMRVWRGVGVMVVAVSLMTAAAAQASADRRRLQQQRRLTDEAREASAAKSRFLTMMSHELRTPMNGVIGTLALMDRTTLDDRQRAMADVARRSAVEMLSLIEDILDLSEIQGGTLRSEPRASTLGELAGEIREALGRRLLGRPAEVSVSASDDGAAPMLVDAALVARIAQNAALFFLDRLGASAVAVALQRRRDELFLTVAASPGPRATWEPEAFFGPLTDPAATIQTEAIGAAVARGLLAHLRGAGVILREADGRTVLRLSIPVRPLAAAPVVAAETRRAV